MAMKLKTPIQACDECVIARPVEEVWRIVSDMTAYPDWWPSSLRVRVLSVAPGLIDSRIEVHPVGGKAFRCRVAAVEEKHRMRMEYYGGFITGSGEWQLEPEGDGTRVRYHLDVTAEGRLVAWLSRFVSLGNLHSRNMRIVLRELERACGRRP